MIFLYLLNFTQTHLYFPLFLFLKGFYATAGWDPTSGIGSVDYTKMKNYFLSLYNGPANYSVKAVRNLCIKIRILVTDKFVLR